MQRRWRIGVLTGGGDSSGINAFLRALCVGVWRHGGDVVGIRNGWAGLVEPRADVLGPADVDGVTLRPGTILGTSRTNVIKLGAVETVLRNIDELRLTHLVVVGGGDTLTVAAAVAERTTVPVIAVPQTIDNDVEGTEAALGFATAVQRGIDTLHGIIPSNRAHGNPMLVEVMGRSTGWLALHIAQGVEADFVALPEFPWSIDELAAVYRARGPAILAVIAEGVNHDELRVAHERFDAFGNPALEGVVHRVAARFAERVGKFPACRCWATCCAAARRRHSTCNWRGASPSGCSGLARTGCTAGWWRGAGEASTTCRSGRWRAGSGGCRRSCTRITWRLRRPGHDAGVTESGAATVGSPAFFSHACSAVLSCLFGILPVLYPAC